MQNDFTSASSVKKMLMYRNMTRTSVSAFRDDKFRAFVVSVQGLCRRVIVLQDGPDEGFLIDSEDHIVIMVLGRRFCC